MDRQHDVFISYNSQDRDAARSLDEKLRTRGYHSWIDVRDTIPGRRWLVQPEGIIETTPSVLVLVGASGLGPWEAEETAGALQQAVEREIPVIPVFLKDAPLEAGPKSLPLFLRNRVGVDLRKESLDRLVQGLSSVPTGRRAGETPALPASPAIVHDKAPLEPYALRLVIHRQGDAYTARFVEPDGQETEPFPLTLPLSDGNRDDLSWYLEEYVGFVGEGDRARASKLEQMIDGWGRDLHDALFENPEGARVHMRLMDAASAGRATSLTIGSVEPEVHVQPWEMMRDRQGPLAFRMTIRRQLQGAGAARRARLPLPLRVLLITARPRAAGFIDPRRGTWRTPIAPWDDSGRPWAPRSGGCRSSESGATMLHSAWAWDRLPRS